MSPIELEWIGTHAPAESEMVRITDEKLACHTEWDALHEFALLAWNGARLYPTLIAGITPDVHPQNYPAAILAATRDYLADRLRDKPGADPIVAAMLQIEGYGVVCGPSGLLPEERAAFDRREAYTLPHRVENVLVHSVDIAGRTWTATKRRAFADEPDTVTPAREGADYSGAFPAALRAAIDLVPSLYVAEAQAFWKAGKGVNDV